MGAVFRHEDFRREYNKKILENAIKDLSSDTKDNDQITGFLGKKGNISREKAMRSGEKLEILDNERLLKIY
jgi:hypothetical protein